MSIIKVTFTFGLDMDIKKIFSEVDLDHDFEKAIDRHKMTTSDEHGSLKYHVQLKWSFMIKTITFELDMDIRKIFSESVFDTLSVLSI